MLLKTCIQDEGRDKGDDLRDGDGQTDQFLTVSQERKKSKTGYQQHALPHEVDDERIAAVIQCLHAGRKDHGDRAKGQREYARDQILMLHHQLIERYGGSHGIRDEGLLDSTLNAPF